jgi:hypothetical protein
MSSSLGAYTAGWTRKASQKKMIIIQIFFLPGALWTYSLPSSAHRITKEVALKCAHSCPSKCTHLSNSIHDPASKEAITRADLHRSSNFDASTTSGSLHDHAVLPIHEKSTLPT